MILSGDCVEVMRGMPDASIDAIVTDPPYGLGFMGKAWDDLPPGLEWAQECLRVLKPGGHLLAFGGSRTYHRLAVAVEDAGFEIRDQIMWLYGSGFPKSLDVSKAIDKAAGAEREVIGKSLRHGGGTMSGASFQVPASIPNLTAPATADAKKWDGWGTALKPAHEPIVVARKPLIGTVAENVLKFGTGALNVDGCRIGSDGGCAGAGAGAGAIVFSDGLNGTFAQPVAGLGRWPANLILDEEAGRLLDEQSGETSSTRGVKDPNGFLGYHGGAAGQPGVFRGHVDSGGASRFFYCAKAGKAERNAGLDGFEERDGGIKNDSGRGFSESDPYREIKVRNHHPTVKPISLMRYLVRLVTPPDGTVLDPFLGSGTTGCAAALEGFDFIGIEREPDYIAIAEARIAWWKKHKGDAEVSNILSVGKGRDEVEDAGQLNLLGEAA